MFSTHLLFPRKLSHEVLRAQHQMRTNMVAFMIEQAHKLLVLPKKRQTSEVPQLCQNPQLALSDNANCALKVWYYMTGYTESTFGIV